MLASYATKPNQNEKENENEKALYHDHKQEKLFFQQDHFPSPFPFPQIYFPYTKHSISPCAPVNAVATEAQEYNGTNQSNKNNGSLLLPASSVFYTRGTVSTIIFSSSDSTTTSTTSPDDHSISQSGGGNSPTALVNAGATEVQECSAHNAQSKWKKGELLGQGAFGRVYKGLNSENGQMCAIKQVNIVPDDETSNQSLKQLHQEIDLLSQLSHPNIVKYYGSERGKEVLSLYLEYVSCGSIYKLLQEYGPFNEKIIQNYTKQIVSGLAYLHSKNIIHRDIKGANILVNSDGEIKLADFGMAKWVEPSSLMFSFKGSVYWMAPEVVNNTHGYTLAVDIWSLGCTILEMATSKPPWSKYKRVDAMLKIGKSQDLPKIPDHLSAEAKSFIKFCLQRDPLARPSTYQLLDHPFIQDQWSCFHHVFSL